jgi:hypothetical protein
MFKCSNCDTSKKLLNAKMQKMTKKIMTAQIRLILGFKNISSNLIISEINE